MIIVVPSRQIHYPNYHFKIFVGNLSHTDRNYWLIQFAHIVGYVALAIFLFKMFTINI